MKKAFTLAEVLITLGVIGVIAAMTLPSLIQKHNEKVILNSLKVDYRNIQNAYQAATIKYGSPENWSNQSYVSVISENYLNIFGTTMQYIKSCGRDTNKKCLNSQYIRLSKTQSDISDSTATMARAILANGHPIVFYITDSTCSRNIGESKILKNVCGWVFVDVNGQKKPNRIGEDGFYFWISKYGIIPIGTQDETFTTTSFKTSCSDSSSQSGFGCSGWFLVNENRDYLYCNDLDWNTKTKCK